MGWLWALLVITFVLLVAWWGFRTSNQKTSEAHERQAKPLPQISTEELEPEQAGGHVLPFVELEAEKESTVEPIPAIQTAPVPIRADDLTLIEGIGSKICGLLQSAGITTFAQLAAMRPEQIDAVLHAAGLRLADPQTWPEQARLASIGDYAALQILQDSLHAGRRVEE